MAFLIIHFEDRLRQQRTEIARAEWLTDDKKMVKWPYPDKLGMVLKKLQQHTAPDYIHILYPVSSFTSTSDDLGKLQDLLSEQAKDAGDLFYSDEDDELTSSGECNTGEDCGARDEVCAADVLQLRSELDEVKSNLEETTFAIRAFTAFFSKAHTCD